MARSSSHANGGSADADLHAAPLTVAAVARSLGVAASTLRTWDRRYGLGPTAHQAGSHRRYTPEDVARLHTMRRLTLRGVAPVDAARIASQAEGSEPDAEEPPDEDDGGSLVLDPLTLAAAAVEPDLGRAVRMLRRAVRDEGVPEAWTNLVVPALEMIDSGRHQLAERPGTYPDGVVHTAFMQVLRELEVSGPVKVRILAGAEDRIAAHVLAGGLAQQDVAAVVVRAERVPANGRSLEWLPERSEVLAVIGNPPPAEAVVSEASDRGDVEIYLLGEESPGLWLPRVHRVRTPRAAMAEIVAAVTG